MTPRSAVRIPRGSVLFLFFCVLALPLRPGVALRASREVPAARFTAFAQHMSGEGRSAPVDIVVERWSDGVEREALIGAVTGRDPARVLALLRDAAVLGSIKDTGPTTWQYDLRYAWQTEAPDGSRRLVLVSDRFISVAERAHDPRSADYPVMVVEISLPRTGAGAGTLSLKARVRPTEDGRSLEVDEYGTTPIRLIDVQAVT